MPDTTTLLGRWIPLLCWAVLPFAAGPALADGFSEASRPVQLVAATGLWSGWAGTLVALLVPCSVSLTAARLTVPAGLAAALWAFAAVGPGLGTSVAVAAAAAAVVAVLNRFAVDVFVDGSSYGEERRYALRTPAALLAGPVELTWAAVAAGAVSGPLLLAAGQWVAGLAALAVGVPAVAFGTRRLHGLSRRWLVFVPAGVVIHDLLELSDALLVTRRYVAAIGPAPVDTDALDASGAALGLALQIDLAEPLAVARSPRRHLRGAEAIESEDVTAVLVTPGRPGAVLEEATRRRLPVA
ncbi:MAG: hypothetical protein MUF83_08945 [Acidimicrobiales bacterium]|jgi:hypothetical protein|nr:hypothetical protein [Acidimicrobiales bacterium]